MSIPSVDISCTNCLTNCYFDNNDSIMNPYSYSNKDTPNYKGAMKCTEKCYENECMGAKTWPKGTWEYYSYKKDTVIAEIPIFITISLLAIFLVVFRDSLNKFQILILVAGILLLTPAGIFIGVKKLN